MRYIKKLIPQKIKNIYHLGQAVLANFWYGFPARKSFAYSVAGGPARKIKVIGVTGTNGKTTTCQMIAKILEEADFKTAMVSTINFKLGEKEWVNKTKFTTLSSFFIQKFAWDAAVSGCEYLILEISSHALDQNRVWGIDFDIAVITNVTREHLDYHKTMEKYREAKLRIFEKARVVVVNLDMEKPQDFLQFNNEEKQVFTCHSELDSESKNLLDSGSGAGMTILRAEDINLGINYSKFQIRNSKFNLNIPGLFNIENALAATCVGLTCNIDLQNISAALEKIKSIPGRLEFVPNNRDINIIIDYAVTPDSLEKLYELISEIKNSLPLEKGDARRAEGFENHIRSFKSSFNSSFSKGGERKIIAVFGACGERDCGKRPIMGEIVSRHADYVIVTNEDPYGEDPQQIIEEISAGIKNKRLNENYWKILDRREAIKKALQLAKPGDYIIVTGKVAEVTMAIGNKRVPWNDRKVILEILRELK
jgi:UDP-N-acetylmuramoyl-L-alanyl-D-glutamate--2,6-diaminopimelate ligase